MKALTIHTNTWPSQLTHQRTATPLTASLHLPVTSCPPHLSSCISAAAATAVSYYHPPSSRCRLGACHKPQTVLVCDVAAPPCVCDDDDAVHSSSTHARTATNHSDSDVPHKRRSHCQLVCSLCVSRWRIASHPVRTVKEACSNVFRTGLL